MTKLINESLGALRLPHDSLPVILTDGPRKFVVVHGRSILPDAPEPGHPNAVLDLEDTTRLVQPPDAGTVLLARGEQLLKELPEMDVCSVLCAGGFGFPT